MAGSIPESTMAAETEAALTTVGSRPGAAGQGPWRRFWRRFLWHRLAVFCAWLLVLLILAVVLGPPLGRVFGLDGQMVDLFNRMAPPGPGQPMGTDELGRDLLIRLMEGGRVSLLVGISGALLTAIIGTAIGLAAGYAGGRTDSFFMRLTDAVIALPLLPLLIVLAAIDVTKLGLPAALADEGWGSVYRIVVLVALFGWTTVARLVRAAVLSQKERDYIRAARALGAGPLRIAIRHILPNIASPIIVATTLSIGNIMLAESVLSFLGLGIQPPLPSWGNMLTNAQEIIWQAPALAIWPGALLFATVIATNILGDGLQDALDPRGDLRR
jgi:peptide/nickel transport system permease protein